MEIVLKDKDIKKLFKDIEGKGFSMSGLLIDELAYSAGQWTEEDLRENNFDYEFEGVKYLVENMDFETSLVKVLNDHKDREELFEMLAEEPLDKKAFAKAKYKLGAWTALKKPELFAKMLGAYEEKVKEDMYSFYDSEFLSKFNPELQKEMQERVDDFWDDMTREWLWGDRDYKGVVAEIRRYFEAEEVQYDHKDGYSFTFIFDDEEIKDRLKEYYGERIKAFRKYAKMWILDRIYSSSQSRFEKEKQEREKRREERERVQKYQKERAEKEEAERIAKLKAMKKKK